MGSLGQTGVRLRTPIVHLCTPVVCPCALSGTPGIRMRTPVGFPLRCRTSAPYVGCHGVPPKDPPPPPAMPRGVFQVRPPRSPSVHAAFFTSVLLKTVRPWHCRVCLWLMCSNGTLPILLTVVPPVTCVCQAHPGPLSPSKGGCHHWHPYGGALSAVRAQCARTLTIWASGRSRNPYFLVLWASLLFDSRGLGALQGEHSLKVARSVRTVRAQCKDSPYAAITRWPRSRHRPRLRFRKPLSYVWGVVCGLPLHSSGAFGLFFNFAIRLYILYLASISVNPQRPDPPGMNSLCHQSPMALCDIHIAGCGEHLPAWGLRDDRIPGTDRQGRTPWAEVAFWIPPPGRGMPAAVRMPACHSRRSTITDTMTHYCGGGGGVIQAGISAFQILYKKFVRNLFGVFKDLCR